MTKTRALSFRRIGNADAAWSMRFDGLWPGWQIHSVIPAKVGIHFWFPT
jgi:hypothetical protein